MMLQDTRAARVRTRMGAELLNVIETTPGIGSLALWVEFLDSNDPKIYTDGRRVVAGTDYDTLDARERRFAIRHELLHVALAHPARGRTMAAQDPDYDHDLFNTAADAIINATLSLQLKEPIPERLVNLKTVLTDIGAWTDGTSLEKAVTSWSTEQLYYALKAHEQRTGSSLTKNAANRTWTVPCDLHPGDHHHDTQSDRDAEIRSWAHRLRAAAGATPGLITRLAADLPTVTTPWPRVLRDYLRRYGSPKRIIDYARPSRRWSALEYPLWKDEHVRLPFHPSTRLGPSARLAVAIDTSGSIDTTLLSRFTAELATLMAATAARVRLIVCDAAVHQIEDLHGPRGIARLRSFRYEGGGGTNFAPAIAAAADAHPDALIFFTDLYGDAGPAPTFPILWAVPPGGGTTPAFGRRLDLI